MTSLCRIDDVETALVVAIPFVAAAMARGLWLLRAPASHRQIFC
jgi:hypothetical protein